MLRGPWFLCEGNILTESTSSAPVGSLSLARSSGFQVSVSGSPNNSIFRFHTTLPNLWRALWKNVPWPNTGQSMRLHFSSFLMRSLPRLAFPAGVMLGEVDVIKMKALTLLLTPFSWAELPETLLITFDIPRSSLIISDMDHLSPPLN